MAPRIPIRSLYANVPIKSDIHTTLPVTAAVTQRLGAHARTLAIFRVLGAFRNHQMGRTVTHVLKVTHYAVVHDGLSGGEWESEKGGEESERRHR